MDELYYLTQMTDESNNFIQMTIFSQKSIWLSFTFEARLHFNATSEYTLCGQLFALLVFEILDFWGPDARHTCIEVRRALFLEERHPFNEARHLFT
jgi:hypothetical protein